MKKLLIFVDWFAPGFKGGGQIQSCVNLSISLQHAMDVRVVTTDRDLGSDEPYTSVVPDTWNTFDENIRVMYLSPGKLGYKSIRSLIREVSPDTIYLNSMFSYSLTLLPLEVCRFERWKTKVILAPRGMLHAGALQYKKLKKQLFFQAFKVRRFHKRIVFHATDHVEESDIKKVFGKSTTIQFIDDFPSSRQDSLSVIPKVPGELKCLFVSRITHKKNLLLILQLLKNQFGKIEFTIVGPTEDQLYWEECKQIIEVLPATVRVNFMGPVANDQLPGIYRNHHLFVLPTYGENFGHVIFESLVNGRPVLISDRSPWRNLQKQLAGWDISLENEAGFTNALTTACAWTQEQFDDHCQASWKLASGLTDTSQLREKYLALFQ